MLDAADFSNGLRRDTFDVLRHRPDVAARVALVTVLVNRQFLVPAALAGGGKHRAADAVDVFLHRGDRM